MGSRPGLRSLLRHADLLVTRRHCGHWCHVRCVQGASNLSAAINGIGLDHLFYNETKKILLRFATIQLQPSSMWNKKS
jgi:hypothetical protein